MQQIVGVTELQRKFHSFFDEVVRKRTPVVLTRGSRPEAALIPYEDYLRFQQMQDATPGKEHTPPVMIIVTDNTDIAELFHKNISGEDVVEAVDDLEDADDDNETPRV